MLGLAAIAGGKVDAQCDHVSRGSGANRRHVAAQSAVNTTAKRHHRGNRQHPERGPLRPRLESRGHGRNQAGDDGRAADEYEVELCVHVGKFRPEQYRAGDNPRPPTHLHGLRVGAFERLRCLLYTEASEATATARRVKRAAKAAGKFNSLARRDGNNSLSARVHAEARGCRGEQGSGRDRARYPDSAACDRLRPGCGVARARRLPCCLHCAIPRRSPRPTISSAPSFFWLPPAPCGSFDPTAFQDRQRRRSAGSRCATDRSARAGQSCSDARTGTDWALEAQQSAAAVTSMPNARGFGASPAAESVRLGRSAAAGPCAGGAVPRQMAGGSCGSATAVMSCPRFRPLDCRRFWLAPFLPGPCVRVMRSPGVTCSRICRPTGSYTRASVARWFPTQATSQTKSRYPNLSGPALCPSVVKWFARGRLPARRVSITSNLGVECHVETAFRSCTARRVLRDHGLRHHRTRWAQTDLGGVQPVRGEGYDLRSFQHARANEHDALPGAVAHEVRLFQGTRVSHGVRDAGLCAGRGQPRFLGERLVLGESSPSAA